MPLAWPLTSISLVNWVRPVASRTPGSMRACAVIVAISSAPVPGPNRIVADAGSVLRYALSVSREMALHAIRTVPNAVRLTEIATTISSIRTQVARRSRRILTVSRLVTPTPPAARR
jgi:hypothetical protein